MQKITPNLWFDGYAREAVEFYVSVFPAGKITGGSTYPNSAEEGLADFQQPLAGQDLTIDFTLAGHDFTAINAGPEFKPNNATTFLVNFDPSQDNEAREHLDEVWEKLADGGEVVMALGEQPYSKRYGWVKDKYGYGWQLILTNPEGEDRPCIIPTLLFGGTAQNKAKEAIDYYVSVFKDAKVGALSMYTADGGPAKAGSSLMFGDFMLAGQWFAAMDAAFEQQETFNEAVSFVVLCKDQAEIDYYWEKLSAFPESEQCGWCKDKFGVSWQIVPENMSELMGRPNAFAKLMDMHKIEIAGF